MNSTLAYYKDKPSFTPQVVCIYREGGEQALPLKFIHDIIIVDVAGPLLIGSSKNSIEPRACATLSIAA